MPSTALQGTYCEFFRADRLRWEGAFVKSTSDSMLFRRSLITVTLHERLAELEEKKLTIVNEINVEGTPDEQRERLLQTVIRTTNEISTIQKQ